MPTNQTPAKTCVHCHGIVILEAPHWPSSSRLERQWFCSHCNGLNEGAFRGRLSWIRVAASTVPPSAD